MAEIQITTANFQQEVLESSKPVVLDFWATWCGPCKMVAPELQALAEKYEDKLIVGKINVDEEGPLAVQHKIVSIPTLLVYENGQLVAKSVGYKPLSALESWLQDEGIL